MAGGAELPILDGLQSRSLPVCAVCSVEFNATSRRPKKLQCGHTFCKECLASLGRNFACPLCRREVCSPTSSDVMSVNTDFEMLSLSTSAPPESHVIQMGHSGEPSPRDDAEFVMDSGTVELNKISGEFEVVRQELIRREDAVQTELECLRQSKQSCNRAIDSYFNSLTNIINRRRQLLKNQLLALYDEKVVHIESENEKLVFTLTCVDSLQRHSVSLTSPSARTVLDEGVAGELEELMERVEGLRMGENVLRFRPSEMLVTALEREVRKAGKIAASGSFPAEIFLGDVTARVGRQSRLQMTVTGFDKQQLNLTEEFAAVLSMHLTNTDREKLTYNVTFSDGGHVVEFLPRMSGEHNLQITFGDKVLCEVVFDVDNCDVTEFSLDVSFNNPNSVAVNNRNEVFITDVGLGKLYKLDTDGELLWEEDIDVNGDVCFDVAAVDNYVICTLGKRDVIHESQEDADAVSTNDEDSETTSQQADTFIPILRSERRDSKEILVYFHTQSFVAVDGKKSVVLMDPQRNTVTVCTLLGEVLQRFTYMFLDCPAYITVSPSGMYVISDLGHDCIKVVNPETFDHVDLGSMGHSKGQFVSPVGTAYYKQSLLVCDVRNDRLQVMTETGDCQFVIHRAGGRALQPWSVCVDRTDRVWVLEKANRSLLKLKL